MKTAAIYVRVSTVGQEDNYSIPTQLESGRKYASQNGLRVVIEIDDAESGATLDRPGLTRLRDLVRKREVDAVIVYCVDRLSRDAAGYYLLKDELKKHEVALHFVTKGEIPNTPEGVLADGLDVLIGQIERLRIAERTKRGKKAKIEGGKILGHGLMAPYGYGYIGKGRTKELIIVPEEVEVVKLLFQWFYYDGLSLNAIVDKLRELRIPTPSDMGRRTTQRQSQYAEWGRTTIGRILHNSAYAGTLYHYRYKRDADNRVIQLPETEWIGVPVPAIISQEFFDAVQIKLRQNQIMSKRNSKHFYLLAKRIRCSCGRAFAGEVSKGTRTYRCVARQRHSLNPCSMGSIRASLIEPLVWQWIVDELEPNRLLAGLLRQREQSASKQNDLMQQIELHMRHFAECEAQLQRIRAAVVAGVFDLQEAAEEKTKVELAKLSVQKELTRLNELYNGAGLSDEDTELIVEFAKELRDEAQQITEDEKRRWLIDKLDVQVEIIRDEQKRLVRVRGRLSSEADLLPLDGIVSTTF